MTLSGKALLYMATPLIEKIIKELIESTITDENLGKARGKLREAIRKITASNDWTWDDKVAEKIADGLKESDFFQEWGDKVLDIVENWVENSATKWDDMIVLPIVFEIREVAGIEDGED